MHFRILFESDYQWDFFSEKDFLTQLSSAEFQLYFFLKDYTVRARDPRTEKQKLKKTDEDGLRKILKTLGSVDPWLQR